MALVVFTLPHRQCTTMGPNHTLTQGASCVLCVVRFEAGVRALQQPSESGRFWGPRLSGET